MAASSGRRATCWIGVCCLLPVEAPCIWARIVAEKRSHFGAAGQLAAMSELLMRGYNVAIPRVDVGDDVLVVDDELGDVRRVQVKSADAREKAASYRVALNFPREQLVGPRKKVELFYMLMIRRPAGWHFLCVPQQELKVVFERAKKPGGGGKGVTLQLIVKEDARDDVVAWGESLKKYWDAWDESTWPVIQSGPGATKRTRKSTRS